MQVRSVIWFLLLLVMGTSACSVRPEGVLSSKQMRRVLVDLHKADGTFSVVNYGYAQENEKNCYYQWVLQKHGVSQAQFDSSLVWYTDKPKIFEKIYLKVIDELKVTVRDLEHQCALLDNSVAEKPNLAFLDSLPQKTMQLAEIQPIKPLEIILDTCLQKESQKPFYYIYSLQMQDSVRMPHDTVVLTSAPKLTFKKVQMDSISPRKPKSNRISQKHKFSRKALNFR